MSGNWLEAFLRLGGLTDSVVARAEISFERPDSCGPHLCVKQYPTFSYTASRDWQPQSPSWTESNLPVVWPRFSVQLSPPCFFRGGLRLGAFV